MATEIKCKAEGLHIGPSSATCVRYNDQLKTCGLPINQCALQEEQEVDEPIKHNNELLKGGWKDEKS